MISNIKSDLYQFLHSPLLFFHLIVPILGALTFVGYYAVSGWDETNNVIAFIQALSTAFPVLIGIITGLVAETEKNAGSFQTMLTTKKSKCIPHMSKIIVLFIFGLAATIMATTLFSVGFQALGYSNFSILFFIKTAILLFLSMIPLYLLSYLVTFLFGKGMGMGLGIVGGLLSALLLTGLGDNVWWYNPWGIASRFSLSIFLTDFGIQQDTKQIKNAIMVLLLLSIILTALLIVIFNRWEGRKSED
ncbi:MAG: lantibiotic immunity ABC transporter MutG family permease subunit [Oscillospiraceae bacterium]